MSIATARTRLTAAASLTLALLVFQGGATSCAASDSRPLTAAERTAIGDTLRRLIVAAYDVSAPGDVVARLMSLYPSSGPVISASGGPGHGVARLARERRSGILG